MSAQETINKALALHQAGALDEAIAEYRLALDRSGGHPAAANLLAVALDEHGRTDEARSVLSDALAGLPKDDPGGYEPALNLARLLVRDNAVLEAAGPLGRAAAVEPDGTTEARGLLFQVAMALLSSDLAEKAAAALLRDESGAAIIGQAIGIAEGAGATGIAMAMTRRAVRSNPLDPSFAIQLGNGLAGLGEGEKAARHFRRALAAAPGEAVAANNLANLLAGDPSAARRQYEHAVTAGAPYADAEANLARLLIKVGAVDDAAIHARRAVAIDPLAAGHREALGLLAWADGDAERAARQFRRTALLAPGHASAWSNLGGAIKPTGHAGLALAAQKRAVTIAPDLVDAHRNIGVQLADLADMDGARAAYAAAMALAPGDAGLAFKAAMTFNTIPADDAEIDAIRAGIDRDLSALRASGGRIDDPMAEVGLPNFYLAYHGRNDRELQETIAASYLELCPDLAWMAPHCRESRKQVSEGRIRIGFFSVFLHEHSIRYIAEGVIQTLDRTAFEVTVFGTQAESEVSVFGSGGGEGCYRRVPNRLDTARRIIAEAALDILVYCDIGMEPLSYYLGFARLAPVQCVLQGHPVTTGIPNIDYFISSAWQEPDDFRNHYSEACVRLSDVAFYYLQEPQAAPGDRAAFGLPADKCLYFCPQTLFKFHPRFDAMLAGIMERDPDGLVLLLKDRSEHRTRQLAARLTSALGANAGRIVWMNRMPRDRFYTLLALSDVVLDTPYFSGGNTTIQSLALGLPTVTLASPHVRGRITIGWMKILETPELIARDGEDYADIAVAAGRDKSFQEGLRKRLAANAPRLFRREAVVREHERFFRAALAAARDGAPKLDWGPKDLRT
jgi:protein O-GlcNAc transferase